MTNEIHSGHYLRLVSECSCLLEVLSLLDVSPCIANIYINKLWNSFMSSSRRFLVLVSNFSLLSLPCSDQEVGANIYTESTFEALISLKMTSKWNRSLALSLTLMDSWSWNQALTFASGRLALVSNQIITCDASQNSSTTSPCLPEYAELNRECKTQYFKLMPGPDQILSINRVHNLHSLYWRICFFVIL